MTSKQDKAGTDIAHMGKNQSLNSTDNTEWQNKQVKDKGQEEVATLLLL